MLRRLALPALIASAAVVAVVPLCEAQEKVSSGTERAVMKAVSGLFAEDGRLLESTSQLAQSFLDLDDALRKDRKGVAIRSGDLWAMAAHAARFDKGKLEGGPEKKVTSLDQAFADGKTVPMAVYGPNKYSPGDRHPLLLFLLPKGADAEAKLTSVIEAHEGLKNEVVLVAIAMTDDFDPGKEAFHGLLPLEWARNLYNIDSDRWYVVAEGEALTKQMQGIAAEYVPDRLAGLILRGATEAVTSTNTKLYPTAVVTTEGSDAVAKAYAELGGPTSTIPAGEGELEALYQWVTVGDARPAHTEFTWETLIKEDDSGQSLFASFELNSPAKRGEPTTATVAYDRDTNTVTVNGENIGEIMLYFNDELLNLDENVIVEVNGTQLANRKFERDIREAFKTANRRGEWGRFYTASFQGYAPTTIEAAADAGEGGEGGEGEGGDKPEGE